MSSYKAKINVSRSKVDNFTFDDFNKFNFDSTFEQVQTIFFKFILNYYYKIIFLLLLL